MSTQSDEIQSTITQGIIAGYDGLALHYTRYHPATSSSLPKATIVFLHGFMDHMRPYKAPLELFASKGEMEVIAFDQRGFGTTAQNKVGGFKKNYTDTTWPQQFKDAMEVIRQQKKWVDEKYGEGRLKLFVMGHSMGGGITAALLTRSPGSVEAKDLAGIHEIVAGTILWSPWITLTKPPAGLLVTTLKLASQVWPSLKYNIGLKVNDIVRDPTIRAQMEADDLIDTWVFVKSVAGPLDGGPRLLTQNHVHYTKKDIPILALHGEADKVTDPAGSKKYIQLLQQGGAVDAQWKGFPEAAHVLMLDTPQVAQESCNYAIDWILARI